MLSTRADSLVINFRAGRTNKLILYESNIYIFIKLEYEKTFSGGREIEKI